MKDVITYRLAKGVQGFRIEALPFMYQQPDTHGNYPDEPLTGECSNSDDSCYLRQIYTENQPESYYMVCWPNVWRNFKLSSCI
jgi:alpha-glucosidase